MIQPRTLSEAMERDRQDAEYRAAAIQAANRIFERSSPVQDAPLRTPVFRDPIAIDENTVLFDEEWDARRILNSSLKKGDLRKSLKAYRVRLPARVTIYVLASYLSSAELGYWSTKWTQVPDTSASDISAHSSKAILIPLVVAKRITSESSYYMYETPRGVYCGTESVLEKAPIDGTKFKRLPTPPVVTSSASEDTIPSLYYMQYEAWKRALEEEEENQKHVGALAGVDPSWFIELPAGAPFIVRMPAQLPWGRVHPAMPFSSPKGFPSVFHAMVASLLPKDAHGRIRATRVEYLQTEMVRLWQREQERIQSTFLSAVYAAAAAQDDDMRAWLIAHTYFQFNTYGDAPFLGINGGKGTNAVGKVLAALASLLRGELDLPDPNTVAVFGDTDYASPYTPFTTPVVIYGLQYFTPIHYSFVQSLVDLGVDVNIAYGTTQGKTVAELDAQIAGETEQFAIQQFRRALDEFPPELVTTIIDTLPANTRVYIDAHNEGQGIFARMEEQYENMIRVRRTGVPDTVLDMAGVYTHPAINPHVKIWLRHYFRYINILHAYIGDDQPMRANTLETILSTSSPSSSTYMASARDVQIGMAPLSFAEHVRATGLGEGCLWIRGMNPVYIYELWRHISSALFLFYTYRKSIQVQRGKSYTFSAVLKELAASVPAELSIAQAATIVGTFVTSMFSVANRSSPILARTLSLLRKALSLTSRSKPPKVSDADRGTLQNSLEDRLLLWIDGEDRPTAVNALIPIVNELMEQYPSWGVRKRSFALRFGEISMTSIIRMS